MSASRWLVLLLPAVFLCPAVLFADDDVRAGLVRCAAIASDEARLDCYDELAGGTPEIVSERYIEAPQPAAAAIGQNDTGQNQSGQNVMPLDDSVGKKHLGDGAPPQVFVARLTRCEKTNSSGRNLFYLDNGQIWKQGSNSDRRRLRDCEADIEISKDVFGFKMRIPGQKRTFRVTRVR